jgi:hypothetical protein
MRLENGKEDGEEFYDAFLGEQHIVPQLQYDYINYTRYCDLRT